MNKNRTLSQVVLISLTLLIMALIVWGVLTDRLLNYEQMNDEMFMKHEMK